MLLSSWEKKIVKCSSISVEVVKWRLEPILRRMLDYTNIYAQKNA